MDRNLISKKELLEWTGISYGQLYRWKRKGLIPEEWFIRKSTFTGQETFFPKDKILPRVERIKNMKEDLSLDDLADVFSPNPTELFLSKEELLNHGFISGQILDFYLSLRGDPVQFPFINIFYIYVLEKMLQTGEISLEEGKLILELLETNPHRIDSPCELVFARKLGISTCLLTPPGELCFEPNTKIVARVNLTSWISELKQRLAEG